MDQHLVEWTQYLHEVGVPEAEIETAVMPRHGLKRRQSSYLSSKPSAAPAVTGRRQAKHARPFTSILRFLRSMLTAAVLIVITRAAHAESSNPLGIETSLDTRWMVDPVVIFLGIAFAAVFFVMWRLLKRINGIHIGLLFLADRCVWSRYAKDDVYGPASSYALPPLVPMASIALFPESLRCLGAEPGTGEWEVGLATSVGPMRERNEDFATAFKVEGSRELRVALVLDGVGGTPCGREASAIAGTAASHAAAVRLKLNSEPGAEIAAVRHAFLAAEMSLREAGKMCGIERGLQTTMICVVSSPCITAFGYIGDGLGLTIRADGEVDNWLRPHKADPTRPNLLSACLGPRLLGQPTFGHFPSQHGDLTIIATDGVGDLLSDDSWRDLRTIAQDCKGDLRTACEVIIRDLESAEDEFGPLASDNLTIAAIGSDARHKVHQPAPSSEGEVILAT